jgi:hypothetical protein
MATQPQCRCNRHLQCRHTLSAGIKATGQKELFFALHYAFIKKVPDGYGWGTREFTCKPDLSIPVGERWEDWSPILPFCVIQEAGREDTQAWGDILAQVRNVNGTIGPKIAEYLCLMCDRHKGMGLGLRNHKGGIQLYDRAALLLSGTPVFNHLLHHPDISPQNMPELHQVRTCSCPSVMLDSSV